MILPATYVGTLIVMILGMLCVGLWANAYKMAGKLRFELFYVDFAIGVGLAAVIYGLTFGNLGFDGFSLMDDLMQVHKHQWLDAFGAGVIFNMANMLLVGAISVAGMAVAFPVALGFALIAGVLLSQLSQRTANPLYLWVGCALVLAAILADAVAYNSLVARRRASATATGKKKTSGPRAIKGLILSVIGGLLMGVLYPLLRAAREGDVGLGPYSLMVLFAAGAFLSTFVFSLFFMNLPVEGEPLEVREYFTMRANRHLFGLAGGILWSTGALATFVAEGTAPEARLGRATELALSYGGPMIAALCGLLVWKEFEEGGGRPKAMAFATVILFAGGLASFWLAFRG
ncbi:MAG: hypothetical protein LAQ69_01120 [Acidobacteriia bacterium]|nr:hypothetical protein [Terriglobia bacterium]